MLTTLRTSLSVIRHRKGGKEGWRVPKPRGNPIGAPWIGKGRVNVRQQVNLNPISGLGPEVSHWECPTAASLWKVFRKCERVTDPARSPSVSLPAAMMAGSRSEGLTKWRQTGSGFLNHPEERAAELGKSGPLVDESIPDPRRQSILLTAVMSLWMLVSIAAVGYHSYYFYYFYITVTSQSRGQGQVLAVPTITFLVFVSSRFFSLL